MDVLIVGHTEVRGQLAGVTSPSTIWHWRLRHLANCHDVFYRSFQMSAVRASSFL